MRRLVTMALAWTLLLASAGGAPAGTGKVACKDIRAAMAGGKSASQVATELGTRVKRVENCMAGKKKGAKKGGDAAGTAAPAAAE